MRTALASSLVCLVVILAVAHGQTLLCRAIGASCASQLRANLRTIQPPAVVAQGCQMAADARRCMGDCLTTSSQSTPRVRAIFAVVEHVCDEDRRDEVEQIFEAQCFRNGALAQVFRTGYDECLRQTMLTMRMRIRQAAVSGPQTVLSSVCPSVDDLLACVIGKIGEACGSETVPFFGEIMQIVIREFMIERIPTCFDQAEATHSVVKRAVDYIQMLQK